MSSFSQRMMGYVAWLGSVSCRLLSTVHCVHYIGYSHPHLTFRHSRLRTLSRGCGGSWTQRCTHTHTKHFPIFPCFATPVAHVANSLNSYVLYASLRNIFTFKDRLTSGVSLHPPLLSGIHPHGQNRGLLIVWCIWEWGVGWGSGEKGSPDQ